MSFAFIRFVFIADVFRRREQVPGRGSMSMASILCESARPKNFIMTLKLEAVCLAGSETSWVCTARLA